MTDQMRWDAMSCSGDWVKTPNLDRIAAEGIRFVERVTEFDHLIRELGPFGQSEGLDHDTLIRKLRASRMAVEGMRLRMVFAKQAKRIKEGNLYGELPEKDKLLATFKSEMLLYETLVCLEEKTESVGDLSRMLEQPEETVVSVVETLRKKKLWEGGFCAAS